MNKSMLDLYVDYLLSSFGHATATGLSRLLDQAVSHDAVTRFLSERPFTSADLWGLVKPLVRQVESDEGDLIIDDSIEEKPWTDESELVTWHFDRTKNRAIKGINFLSALYQVGQTSLPVGFDLVTKTEEIWNPQRNKWSRKSLITKNDRYRQLLRASVHNRIHFRYVLNDSWYASVENMKFVQHELRHDFIMAVKSNRHVATSLADKKAGRYVTAESLMLEAGTVQRVYLEGLDFPLSLLRKVFTNEDGSLGILYLITSDLALTYEAIVARYHKRWRVEEYHKSLKSNASLAKSPAHTFVTQTNHFFASVCAFIKLETLKMKTSLNHFALKSKLYLAALKTAYQQFDRMAAPPLQMEAA